MIPNFCDVVSKVERDSLIETHISWVFLKGDYAYKVKKPVDFGFLNFSTLELRKKYCERELSKNRDLCGDIYLEVLPVVLHGDEILFGEGDEIIDFCVKMKRLPEDRKMSNLLFSGLVSEKDVLNIARTICDFHEKLPLHEDAREYGSRENIEKFCEQNFEQTEEHVGTIWNKKDFDFIKNATTQFLKKNEALFVSRVEDGFVKDCHGDLHSGNIFILENGDVKIFDALEFNLALSVTDVMSDIAFMAMDLDFHGEFDLSEKFVDACYVLDRNLLNFYKCYRAYVRCKIAIFSSEFDKAKKYFQLALRYARMI